MFKAILAIVASFFIIKYREKIVATTGKFAWCEQYLGRGGTYNFMIILAVLLFLWGVATITGTTDVILGPVGKLFRPEVGGGGGGGGF